MQWFECFYDTSDHLELLLGLVTLQATQEAPATQEVDPATQVVLLQATQVDQEVLQATPGVPVALLRGQVVLLATLVAPATQVDLVDLVVHRDILVVLDTQVVLAVLQAIRVALAANQATQVGLVDLLVIQVAPVALLATQVDQAALQEVITDPLPADQIPQCLSIRKDRLFPR